MNSSFPGVDPAQWRRLGRRWLAQPLGRALLLALGLNGLLLLLAALTPLDRPAGAAASASGAPPLEDGPQLLRFGRRLQAAQARLDAQAGAVPGAGLPPLSVTALAALEALPPPPPELLPQAGRSRTAGAPAPPRAVARTQGAAAGPLSPDGGTDLPGQPAEVLELARGWIPGAREGAIDGFSEAAQAVRRRLLWPGSPQAPRLLALWRRARPAAASPFPDLGAAVEVRRLAPGSAAELAQVQGLTLVEREALLLVWRDGDGLWLIRAPFRAEAREGAAGESAARGGAAAAP